MVRKQIAGNTLFRISDGASISQDGYGFSSCLHAMRRLPVVVVKGPGSGASAVPDLLDEERVQIHVLGALAQDAPSAIEIMQRLEQCF